MSTKAKKTAHRLTVLFVNSNKLAPGLYGDGNNLFLSVRQSGSRSWVFRFRQRGGDRIREMGLGTAGPDGVSLQDARDRAVALRLIRAPGAILSRTRKQPPRLSHSGQEDVR